MDFFAAPKLLSIRFCFPLKLLPFYLCLLAIAFEAIFGSTFPNGERASLSTNKESGGSMLKPVAGKLVMKRKLPNTNIKSPMTKNKRGRKNKSAIVKENASKLLIELLPKALIKLVIEYFSDERYSILVSIHNWLLQDVPKIAVDSARLYVLTKSKGIKGLNHSLSSVSEDGRQLIEFGDPKWSNYLWSGSSHDGEYVFFSHSYELSTVCGGQTVYGAKWLMQSNKLEGGRLKYTTLDGEDLPYGLLSRDGQTLVSYDYQMDPTTHIYRFREEAEKDTFGFIKFELDGAARAVSGKGNRVMVAKPRQVEVHDISKDASKLACQIGMDTFWCICALNEDGSEAALVTSKAGLRIIDVDNVSGPAMNQSAIVTVKVSGSLGRICELVYSDGGQLHALHDEGKVSLFNPLTKELILLEAPQEGQNVIGWAISPNAGYIATVQDGSKEGQQFTHTTTVKRKLRKTELEDLFGYKDGKDKASKPEGKGQTIMDSSE